MQANKDDGPTRNNSLNSLSACCIRPNGINNRIATSRSNLPDSCQYITLMRIDCFTGPPLPRNLQTGRGEITHIDALQSFSPRRNQGKQPDWPCTQYQQTLFRTGLGLPHSTE